MAGKQENMILLYVVIAIMAIIIIYMVMNKSNGMQENFYSEQSNTLKCKSVSNQNKYNSGFYHGQTLAKFYYRTVLSSLDNSNWDNAFVLGTFDGLKNLINYYYEKINNKKSVIRFGNGKSFIRKQPPKKCVVLASID